jgi:hypothetical protein
MEEEIKKQKITKISTSGRETENWRGGRETEKGECGNRQRRIWRTGETRN